MGKYNLSTIGNIIVKRPNKNRIVAAQKLNKKLMLHVHGIGMKNALTQLQYFENNDIYKARRDYAISNVDLFGRLLQEEEQVFTQQGGSQYFNLPDADEKAMNKLLSNVIYGDSLHKWVANFGINAYRCDPMGVIFMEVEKATDIEGADDAIAGESQQLETPQVYPVYKCIQDIWEMQSNGRKLDYICFKLNKDELEMYGIQAPSQSAYPNQDSNTPLKSQYFRFVDDEKDVIVKRETGGGSNGLDGATPGVTIVQLNGSANPITGLWGIVPGFIVSDLINFADPGSFNTPLQKVVELADSFLTDRSVKDLQQKYHGFAKAVEPLVTCVYCKGEGFIKGIACPECTIPGQDRGTGYKNQTKISDSLKIPMDILDANKAPRFDFRHIFGYVTPDIASWDKQDDSLVKMEQALYITYWGCANNIMEGFNGKQSQDETATKTISSLQSKYARLNKTADWGEITERAIANLIGAFTYRENWKGANISYNRNYILETPDTILLAYYDMKANGVPDSMLDNQYERYIKALWQSNPVQALIYQKKFDTEPFPHLSADDVELSNYILNIDKLCKRYFGEWDDTLTDPQWVMTDVTALRAELITYATTKDSALQLQQQKEDKRQLALNPPAQKMIA